MLEKTNISRLHLSDLNGVIDILAFIQGGALYLCLRDVQPKATRTKTLFITASGRRMSGGTCLPKDFDELIAKAEETREYQEGCLLEQAAFLDEHIPILHRTYDITPNDGWNGA